MEEDEGAAPVGARTEAPGRYLALTVTVPRQAAEAAAALLHDARTGGVVEEEAPRGQIRLRAYLPITPIAQVTLGTLRAHLAAFPAFGLGEAPVLEVAEVGAAAWAAAWREHVRPFPVGRRFWIVPSWEAAAGPADRLVIRLDPGMAFGSGLHASTQLCVPPLEDLVRPGGRVADVGTGSGILAIVAARLGGSVMALDVDPVAVEVARGNVEANGVADRVVVLERDLLTAVDEVFDVIVANLTAELLARLAPQVPGRLRAGGLLVASGIAQGQTGRVRAAFAARGLAVVREEAQEDWTAVVAAKRRAR